MGDNVTTGTGQFAIHSEERGPHWIAWATKGHETRPVRDVVIVGETRQEAETRARAWVETAAAQGYLDL